MPRPLKPNFDNKLMQVWMKALEKHAEHDPATGDFRMKVKFKNSTSAESARFELYRIRSTMRKLSERNLDQEDPNWGKSPFDIFKLTIEGNTITILPEDSFPTDFVIEEDDPIHSLVKASPRRHSKKKKEDEPKESS